MSHGHQRGGGRQAHRQRLHRADRQGAPDGVRGRDEPPDRAADGGLDWLSATTLPNLADGAPRARPRAPDRRARAARRFRGDRGLGVHADRQARPRRLPGRAGRRGDVALRASTARSTPAPRRRRRGPDRHAARRRPPRSTPSSSSATSARSSPATTPFVARNDARLDRRRVRLRPARRARSRRRSSSRPLHEQAGTALHWRAARRARGGRRGRGLARQSRSAADDEAWSTASSSSSSARTRACASSALQDLDETSWVFGDPARRGRPRRLARLDHARLRLGQRQGLPGDPARRRGRRTARSPAPTPRAGASTSTSTRSQEHAAPDTTSRPRLPRHPRRPLERGLARDDQGRPGRPAAPTPSRSRATCCSPSSAHADAIPGLEILANDVRCTHAAAIAQIDREQLFYLRSRGLPEAAAQRLVIEGFLQALVERFEEGPVREAVGAALERRLAVLVLRPSPRAPNVVLPAVQGVRLSPASSSRRAVTRADRPRAWSVPPASPSPSRASRSSPPRPPPRPGPARCPA